MSIPYKATIKRLLRPFNLVMPTTLHGRRFKVPIMRGVGGSHRTGSEPWMVEVLQGLFRIKGRAGLIDVGVNIGQTLLKLRSLDPTCRYVGFEPNPFCVLFANDLIELNRFQNCAILPVALSTRAGLIDFMAESAADSAASIVPGLRPDTPNTRRQYIPMLRFDDIAGELNLEDIPVVKIDVEGAEPEVIAGMQLFLRRCRPIVVCEVLHAHSTAQIDVKRTRNAALMDLLRGMGYSVRRIIKDADQAQLVALEPVQAFPDEIFFYRTSMAVCDYLFIPDESVAVAEIEFGKAAASVSDSS